MNKRSMCDNGRLRILTTTKSTRPSTRYRVPGLEKVLISPWLVTLLHICGVIPTPQSPETPWRYRRQLRAIVDVATPSADGTAPSADVTASSDDVSASSVDIVASNDLRAIGDVAAPNADVSTSSADVSASSADIVGSNDDCFMMFHNVLGVSWFTSGSWCFTCVLWCLTMFCDV